MNAGAIQFAAFGGEPPCGVGFHAGVDSAGSDLLV